MKRTKQQIESEIRKVRVSNLKYWDRMRAIEELNKELKELNSNGGK